MKNYDLDHSHDYSKRLYRNIRFDGQHIRHQARLGNRQAKHLLKIEKQMSKNPTPETYELLRCAYVSYKEGMVIARKKFGAQKVR